MFDFNRYFLPEQQIFLENISYELLKPAQRQYKMRCKDTIVARIIDAGGVKITFNRAVSFEPEGIFYLSVSFSAVMRFRTETHDEVDWKTIDLAGEFRSGGGVMLHNLSSRAALLIAEITSASGQTPIITSAGSPKAKPEASS